MFITFKGIVKKTIALVIVFSVLIQTGGKLFILGYFYFNQSRLAKEVCVQRDSKKNCCQAKCYLNKKLKQTNSTNTSQRPQLSSLVEPGLFVSTITPFRIKLLPNGELHFFYRFFNSSTGLSILLKPPIV